MGPRLWQTSGSVWKQSCLAVPVYPWLPEKLGQSWRGGHTTWDFGPLEAQPHPAPPLPRSYPDLHVFWSQFLHFTQ